MNKQAYEHIVGITIKERLSKTAKVDWDKWAPILGLGSMGLLSGGLLTAGIIQAIRQRKGLEADRAYLQAEVDKLEQAGLGNTAKAKSYYDRIGLIDEDLRRYGTTKLY